MSFVAQKKRRSVRALPRADMRFRILLSTVLSECGKTREQIAAIMSGDLGTPITASILNDYTVRNGAGARFPAAYIDAFCEATGDDRIRKILLPPRLRAVMDIGRNVLEAIRESRVEIAAILEEEARKGSSTRL
jgi:hypothetical protein